MLRTSSPYCSSRSVHRRSASFPPLDESSSVSLFRKPIRFTYYILLSHVLLVIVNMFELVGKISSAEQTLDSISYL